MSIKIGEKGLLPQAYPTDPWTLPEDCWASFLKPHPEYLRDLDGDIIIEIDRKLDGEPVCLEDQPYCKRIVDGPTVSFSAHDQLDGCCARSLKDYLIRDNNLGAYHPYSNTALSKFAFTLHHSNRLEQVVSLRPEVAIRREKILGADDDDTFRAKEAAREVSHLVRTFIF